MSSQQKADAFQKEAENNGWTVECSFGDGPDHVIVDCRRGDEHINIFWIQNTLTETPKYTLAGTTTSLHNKATATRQLSLKPNLERAYKRSTPRRAQQGIGAVSDSSESAPADALPIVRHPLPFDLWESTDKEILKALRGNKIVYLNTILGYAQAVMIHKQLNMNLLHFNIVQAGEKPARPTGQLLDPEGGRPILNFVTVEGFKSVAIEQILQVV